MLYQVTIQFRLDDEFMSLVPAHRTYINYLINKNVIEHYAVSMEVQTSWITIHGESKDAVERILVQSPLYKYWTFEIAELFVMDGYGYRLPSVQPN
jgi:hypothetical protein